MEEEKNAYPYHLWLVCLSAVLFLLAIKACTGDRVFGQGLIIVEGNTDLKDARIREGSPTINFEGQYVRLGDFGGDETTIVYTTSSDIPSIPSTSIIDSGFFRLYGYSNNDDLGRVKVKIRLMRRSDVNISQVTWNVYKTGSNWGTAGGLNTSSDIYASPDTTGYFYYLDSAKVNITGLIKKVAGQDSIYNWNGIHICIDSAYVSGQFIDFNHASAGTGPAYPAFLIYSTTAAPTIDPKGIIPKYDSKIIPVYDSKITPIYDP